MELSVSTLFSILNNTYISDDDLREMMSADDPKAALVNTIMIDSQAMNKALELCDKKSNSVGNDKILEGSYHETRVSIGGYSDDLRLSHSYGRPSLLSTLDDNQNATIEGHKLCDDEADSLLMEPLKSINEGEKLSSNKKLSNINSQRDDELCLSDSHKKSFLSNDGESACATWMSNSDS